MHTKEPWAASGVEVVTVAPVELRIVAQPFTCGTEGPVLPVSVQHANARRIVACVNACEGLDTVALRAVADMGGLGNRLPVIKELMARNTELAKQVEVLTATKLEALPTEGLVWVCLNAEGMPQAGIRQHIESLSCMLTKAKVDGKTSAQFILTASLWPGQVQIQALPDEELARVGLIRTSAAVAQREELRVEHDEALSALEGLIARAECYGMGSNSEAYATAQAVLAKSRGDA